MLPRRARRLGGNRASSRTRTTCTTSWCGGRHREAQPRWSAAPRGRRQRRRQPCHPHQPDAFTGGGAGGHAV